jgi:glycerate kinase
MRVLIAFDKFKDALDASSACRTVAAALRRERPDWELDLVPLSDGGEGFCNILTLGVGGSFARVPASGPRFDAMDASSSVSAPIGWVDLERLSAQVLARLALPEPARRLAVIEMAAVNGLGLLELRERDVWHTCSWGTGELLAAAVRDGADAVLLGVGGSATSDLGLGALGALGLRFEGHDGRAIARPLPARWHEIERLAGHVSFDVPLRIACDVDSPLLGPRGAASVYGPQKGLRPADLPEFEARAARLAALLSAQTQSDPRLAEEPGAGAAGGIAFGLRAAAGARLVAGFALVAEWFDLEARIARADWVITGEGRFDSTSLAGKGPGALVTSARRAGRRALVLAGRVQLTPAARADLAPDVEAIAISNPRASLQRALADTAQNLGRAAREWSRRQ